MFCNFINIIANKVNKNTELICYQHTICDMYWWSKVKTVRLSTVCVVVK